MPSSLIGPAIGAIAGGLTSKKGKEQTQTQKPYLPPEYEQAYQGLLSRGLDLSNKPYDPGPMLRVGAPKDWLDNPVLWSRQQMSDQQYKANQAKPQDNTTAKKPVVDDALISLARNIGYEVLRKGQGFNQQKGGFLQGKPYTDYANSMLADPNAFITKSGVSGGVDQAYPALIQYLQSQGIKL